MTEGKKNKNSLTFVLAIIGTVTGLIGAATGLVALCNQQKQWKQSLGRVQIIKTDFVYWKEYTDSTFWDTKFGFNINYIRLKDSFKIGIPFRLIAFDTLSQRKYKDIEAFTLQDFNRVLHSELEHHTNINSIIPLKLYKIEFNFEVVGVTPVYDLIINIETKHFASDKWNAPKYPSKVDFSPGVGFKLHTEVEANIDTKLPKYLEFRIPQEYFNGDNEKILDTLYVTFNSETSEFGLRSAPTIL
jgi:hypothetical protein